MFVSSVLVLSSGLCTQVDPFMTDNSGGAFKYYPGHSVYEGMIGPLIPNN